MPARNTKSRTAKTPDTSAAPVGQAASGDPSQRFAGQWNHLVSTTNWEKGRIICQWREELEAAGEQPGAFSDEAWAELVGGVTSQHVGRLRRTFQKFGESFDQYEGLYWSHFHAALEWEDAEMWLEGAIQNDWSISQMRGKRWETLGKPGKAPQIDDATAASGEMEIDAASEETADARAETVQAAVKAAGASSAAVADEEAEDAEAPAKSRGGDGEEDEAELPAAKPTKADKRLKVEVDDLPDDLADAFEQFKLAIIGHRRGGWRETTPEAVIECLDALRELALASGD